MIATGKTTQQGLNTESRAAGKVVCQAFLLDEGFFIYKSNRRRIQRTLLSEKMSFYFAAGDV